MSVKLSRIAVFVALTLSCSLALAANPILVGPNPVLFGTVDENSTSFAQTIFLSNTSTSGVQVTAMALSGTNASDFAFLGPNCVSTISAGGFCEMDMTFTPAGIGNRTAALMISVSGQTSALSVPLQGTGGNPLPVITALSPNTHYVGTAAFKLTITGTGFLPSSVVWWTPSFNTASPLTTTFVNSTTLTAEVLALDITTVGQDSLTVVNPAPGGGSSSAFLFPVLALDPSINSLTPSTLVSGTAASPMVVSGANFVNKAIVLWNGNPLPTTYISPTAVQAEISATDLANATIAQVSVSNPGIGGVSDTSVFNVTYPNTVLTLDLPANDLAWDPFAKVIYASLPSSYGVNGNSIAVINPTTGAVTYHFVGSEPNQIALSGNGNFLYVGLNGSSSVQRFILPAFTPDIEIKLNTNSQQLVAGAIAVSPTNAHFFAVFPQGSECCSNQGPIEFFDDATLLADKITNEPVTQLLFASATTLYGYSNDQLFQVSVNSSGGTLGMIWDNLVQGTAIQFDAGLIYGGNGQVLNPATGAVVGTYDVTDPCCGGTISVLPDAPINRSFALGQTPFFPGFGITAYNLSEFIPLAATNLNQLTGNGSDFLQWGSSGLAFVVTPQCCDSSSSQVILVQSPSMLQTTGSKANPVPTLSSMTPASATHGTGNFKMTLEGTGFVPGSQVTWNGKQLTVEYLGKTKLTVFVPGSVVTSGTATVVVTNPAPAGGSSNPRQVAVN